MKQFLPKKACLKCLGCCRFSEAESVWLPCLLDKEIEVLSKRPALAAFISPDKRILPVASKDKEIFFCPFLNPQNNRCRIYASRPFECRLYPFLVNRSKGKIYLAVDTNCLFVKKKTGSRLFKDYVSYLARLLSAASFRKLLKDNPQIIQSYPEAVNIAEIKV